MNLVTVRFAGVLDLSPFSLVSLPVAVFVFTMGDTEG